MIRNDKLICFLFSILFFQSVGAGSAGAVVANRLSEDPKMRVLLLEAGGYETFQSEIPMLAARLQLSKYDWKYKTVPQTHACQGESTDFIDFSIPSNDWLVD